jgi:hypothetical protein
LLDVFLLGVVYFLGRQKHSNSQIFLELEEERKILKELQFAVKEEAEIGEQKCREILGRVTAIATDIEMEVKQNGEVINKEVEQIIAKISDQIQEPLKSINIKQASLEALLKKIEKERLVLNKSISRGEKLVKFFNGAVPYEEVLKEIEDKKYSDARQLLTKGFSPNEVASELGLPLSEVMLLASFG